MMKFPHPLENITRTFLSSDRLLMPETIRQIHLLELWVFLAVIGFLLLVIFRRYLLQIPPHKIKIALFVTILVSAALLRVVSAGRGFETMALFDSVHYAVPAAEFLERGNLIIPINQQDHPISKAPGFSLLIAPIYLIFQNNLGTAVFCPLLLSMVSLFLLYCLAKRLVGDETALIALLLLAFSPLHITYSKIIMSSVPALFFVLCGTLLLIKAKGNIKILPVAGLLLGFAAVIYYLAVAIIPAALIYSAIQNNKGRQDRIKGVVSLLLGAAIPLGGLFYYQWHEFGSPWLTGYSYWTYFTANMQRPFSLDYALATPAMGGGSPNALFTLISATGAYIPFPNILFSRVDQIGLALMLWVFAIMGFLYFYKNNRPFFFLAVSFFFFYYLPHSLLYAQGAYYMLSVVPFLILMAATGINQALKRLALKARSLIWGGMLIGLLSFLPFAYSFSNWPLEPKMREYLELMENGLPNDSYLISDYDAVLFTHEVGRKKDIYIIESSHHTSYGSRSLYWKGKALPPSLPIATEHIEDIKQLIKKGKGVYLSNFNENEYTADYQRIASEFDLNLIARSKNFKLYQLSKH